MYEIRAYCPDCMGENDAQGCFGGGFDDPEGPFDTVEQAKEAGYKSVHDSPWAFQVKEIGGNVVYDTIDAVFPT